MTRDDVAPVILVCAIIAMAMIWNAFIGISMSPSTLTMMAIPAIFLSTALFYSTLRTDRAIAEPSLYIGLWIVFPVFGTLLTYLSNRAGMPLRDHELAAADQFFGFDWLTWAKFVSAHQLFYRIQVAAYESYFWQPLVAVIIFSIWGPAGRNEELLTSILIGLFLTITVNFFVPTISPQTIHGFKGVGQLVMQLRSGFLGPYPYAGIIAFPSFHAVMALLFIYAFRDRPKLLIPVVIINSMMLLSIPVCGDHYLTDILGGGVVAAAAIFLKDVPAELLQPLRRY